MTGSPEGACAQGKVSLLEQVSLGLDFTEGKLLAFFDVFLDPFVLLIHSRPIPPPVCSLPGLETPWWFLSAHRGFAFFCYKLLISPVSIMLVERRALKLLH